MSMEPQHLVGKSHRCNPLTQHLGRGIQCWTTHWLLDLYSWRCHIVAMKDGTLLQVEQVHKVGRKPMS